MRIEITGRHVDVTEAIKEYARKRVEHHLADFPFVQTVHVILNVERFRRTAEIVVTGRSHLQAEAKDESDDLYASIDRVVDKIVRQLNRFREKRITQHHEGEKLGRLEARKLRGEETPE
jgi:putative sigma-54 modulation protein